MAFSTTLLEVCGVKVFGWVKVSLSQPANKNCLPKLKSQGIFEEKSCLGGVSRLEIHPSHFRGQPHLVATIATNSCISGGQEIKISTLLSSKGASLV